MPESVLVAEVRRFPTLRQPEEKTVSLLRVDTGERYIEVSSSTEIKSRIYDHVYISGNAFMAFSINPVIVNSIFRAEAGMHDREGKYKLFNLFVQDLRAVMDPKEGGDPLLPNSVIKAHPIFFDQIVADTLDLHEGQLLRLVRSPIWIGP
ncbi:MAG: hypothetical protein ACP5UH_03230 [Candidatus Micrarchaeia archaeon]